TVRSPAGNGKSALSIAVYASMACVKASMPLSAVTFGGPVTVMNGSTTAALGRSQLERMPTLIWFSVSVTTDAAGTPDPVPGVVGTQIKGEPGPGILSSPT